MEKVIMTKEDIEIILKEHRLWLSSNGEEGSCANLEDANLANVELANANLEFANLEGANLRNANLAYANLANTDLANAKLMNANLVDADLACANLVDADLANANLAFANLANANLACANLANANLVNANLEDACLTGVDITNTKLENREKRYNIHWMDTDTYIHDSYSCKAHTAYEALTAIAALARQIGISSRAVFIISMDAQDDDGVTTSYQFSGKLNILMQKCKKMEE